MKPTQRQLAECIEDFWECYKGEYPPTMQDEMIKKYPFLEEIEKYGPSGPIGQGLGIFGGHAIS